MFPPDAKALVVGGNRGIRLALAGSRLFARKHAFITKAVPTALGFAFGDVLTQFMNSRNTPQQTKQPAFSYEWQRGAKMALCGLCLATPVGLGLLRVLDAHVMTSNPSGPLAVSVKFTLDQIVGCAIWQACYCAIHPPYRVALEELLASVQANLEEQSQQVSQEVRQVSQEFRRKLHLQTC